MSVMVAQFNRLLVARGIVIPGLARNLALAAAGRWIPFWPGMTSILATLPFLVAMATSCSKEPIKEPPHGFVQHGSHRFSVDTSKREYKISVKGHKNSYLIGRLEDSEGRRSIHHHARHIKGASLKQVAEKDWNLPPAAAMNAKGETLICWNHLDGETSALTFGGLPDPPAGVKLNCKLSRGQGLEGEFRVGEFAKVAWLRDVIARVDGSFNVTFYVDNGWLGGAKTVSDAEYMQVFDGERLTAPRLIDVPCAEQ